MSTVPWVTSSGGLPAPVVGAAEGGQFGPGEDHRRLDPRITAARIGGGGQRHVAPVRLTGDGDPARIDQTVQAAGRIPRGGEQAGDHEAQVARVVDDVGLVGAAG